MKYKIRHEQSCLEGEKRKGKNVLRERVIIQVLGSRWQRIIFLINNSLMVNGRPLDEDGLTLAVRETKRVILYGGEDYF
jgi:hypothetical protein